jgi:hypothetical protein
LRTASAIAIVSSNSNCIYTKPASFARCLRGGAPQIIGGHLEKGQGRVGIAVWKMQQLRAKWQAEEASLPQTIEAPETEEWGWQRAVDENNRDVELQEQTREQAFREKYPDMNISDAELAAGN